MDSVSIKIAADLLKVRLQEAYSLAVARRTGISYEILQPQLQDWVDKRWLRTQGEYYQVTGLGWHALTKIAKGIR